MKLFNFTNRKIKDSDLMKMAEIEYKKDALFAYNWMKANPGKTLDMAEHVK